MSPINASQQNSEYLSKNEDYPSVKPHVEKLFIVVKTYPRPHRGLKETVCTAGITKKGKWIRLFPLDFRFLSQNQRYSKYQWIEINIKKSELDLRRDTYQPDSRSIKLGEIVGPQNYKTRKKIVLSTSNKSLEELIILYKKRRISLGIIKPRKVIDFIIEPDSQTWKPRQQQILQQSALFGRQPKKLDKIPYKFSYKFYCDDRRCSSHKLSIVDWEIFELYRTLKVRNPFDMQKVLEKIKDKWYKEMLSKNKDFYFIIGTQFRWPTWMVLGVFWPPKG